MMSTSASPMAPQGSPQQLEVGDEDRSNESSDSGQQQRKASDSSDLTAEQMGSGCSDELKQLLVDTSDPEGSNNINLEIRLLGVDLRPALIFREFIASCSSSGDAPLREGKDRVEIVRREECAEDEKLLELRLAAGSYHGQPVCSENLSTVPLLPGHDMKAPTYPTGNRNRVLRPTPVLAAPSWSNSIAISTLSPEAPVPENHRPDSTAAVVPSLGQNTKPDHSCSWQKQLTAIGISNTAHHQTLLYGSMQQDAGALRDLAQYSSSLANHHLLQSVVRSNQSSPLLVTASNFALTCSHAANWSSITAHYDNAAIAARKHSLQLSNPLGPSRPSSRSETCGLWFTLQPARFVDPDHSQELPPIKKHFLRIRDRDMRVVVIKKYLKAKLSLDHEEEVEITCRGRTLSSNFTMQYICDHIWMLPSACPTTTTLMSTNDDRVPFRRSTSTAATASTSRSADAKDQVMVLVYRKHLESSMKALTLVES